MFYSWQAIHKTRLGVGMSALQILGICRLNIFCGPIYHRDRRSRHISTRLYYRCGGVCPFLRHQVVVENLDLQGISAKFIYATPNYN